MINFVINFLAIIGLLILISYFVSYLIEYYKKRASEAANRKVMPPPSYMQNNGIRCPDYFSNIGADKTKYSCSNRDFNINTLGGESCFSDVNNQVVSFPTLPDGKTWEFGNPNGLTTMTDKERWDFVRTKVDGNPTRCDWVQNCGPSKGVKGIWQGVENICNAPDPSQNSIN